MKCPHCGGYHRASSKFCTKTGKKIILNGDEPGEKKGTLPKISKENITKLHNVRPATDNIVKKTELSVNKKSYNVAIGEALTQLVEAPPEETIVMAIERCTSCGTPISRQGAKFCIACGMSLVKREVKPVKIDKPKDPAPKTLSRLIPRCPYSGCKRPVKEDSLYCGNCYKQLVLCSKCKTFNSTWKTRCSKCNEVLSTDFRNWRMFQGNGERTGNSLEELDPPLKRKWVYPSTREAARILSSPIVYKGMVYYGSCDMNLHALNQYTGNPVWKRPTNGFVLSTPAVYDNVVYAASCDGKVYACDARRGKPLWVFPRQKSQNIGKITSQLLACKEGVFVYNVRGEIYRLDSRNGKLIWKLDVSEETKKSNKDDDSIELTSSPAIIDGMVFIATPGGRIICIDIATGAIKWRFPKDKPVSHRFVSTPVLCARHCYVPDRSGQFYSISLTTGEDDWVYTVDIDGVVEGSASVGYGKIIIGSQNEHLIALDLHSGGEVWRVKNERINLIDSIFSTPVITSNNLVFYGSDTGYIYCRNIKSSEETWKEKLDSPIRSSPAVSDGFLYVTTSKGFLYAFCEDKES